MSADPAIVSTEGTERDWVFARRFAIRRMIERGDPSAADHIPDIPETGVLASQVEYLRWCMERAVEQIESGKEWDAENTLRVGLDSGSPSTANAQVTGGAQRTEDWCLKHGKWVTNRFVAAICPNEPGCQVVPRVAGDMDAQTRHSTVGDGFGSEWVRCGERCDLQVVRPGKVQCNYTDDGCPNARENGSEAPR